MKALLNRLLSHQTLSQQEAHDVLKTVASGEINDSQIAAFLTVYLMRGITIEELEGFRDAMLELCQPVDLRDFAPIDVCGTGGDGRDTFNVSTLAAFVVAGAGQPVAKHGNAGVSSVCGSSNVMEYLGYRFTNDADTLRRQIGTANICFLHAPLFHPAMKHVAPVRRALGVKTFFNMLGPMVNPAAPPSQLVGVFSLDLARKYGYLYQRTDRRFAIVHTLDGYDEISLTGPFKLISDRAERVLTPADLGLPTVAAEELYGGKSVAEAGEIFRAVIENRGTAAQRAVVVANAGLALYCARPSFSLPDAVAAAEESLASGRAAAALEKLLSL